MQLQTLRCHFTGSASPLKWELLFHPDFEEEGGDFFFFIVVFQGLHYLMALLHHILHSSMAEG